MGEKPFGARDAQQLNSRGRVIRLELDTLPLTSLYTIKDGMLFKNQKVWQDSAVCKNAPEVDQMAFTGPSTSRSIAQDINARYCSHCPVKTECVEWANQELPFTGIAGGMAFIGERNARFGRRIVKIQPAKE